MTCKNAPSLKGKAPKFDKSQMLEARHVIMIAIGGVIGAGFFVGASAAILQAGPAILLTYILCSLVFLVLGMTFKDLALDSGVQGSFIEHIRHLLGSVAGFASGWSYWAVWLIILTAQLIAGAAMLQPVLHLPYLVICYGLLAIMSGVNLLSVRAYGNLEYWFSFLKVSALVVFILFGIFILLSSHLGFTAPVPVTNNLFGHDGFAPFGWVAVLALAPTVFTGMTGIEIVSVAAQETHTPEEMVGALASKLGIWIGVIYFFSVLLVLCFIPWNGLEMTRSPFLSVLNHLQIPYAESVIWLVVLTVIFSTLNSSLFVASRVLKEMALTEAAPDFLSAGKGNNVPTRSIWCVTIAAFLLVTASQQFPSGFFGGLLSVSGVFIIFVYGLAIVAAMKMRRKLSFFGILAILFMALVPICMLYAPQTRLQSLLGLGSLGFFLLCGAIISRLSKRKNASDLANLNA
ncbi:amino acid permease [Acetobacteraceae bacterium]|nr:amino acid permease [Acetobacteraceae bacterium]